MASKSVKFDSILVEQSFGGTVTPKRRYTLEESVAETPEYFAPVSLETPIATPKQRWSVANPEANGEHGQDSVITVAVRVRPFSSREQAGDSLRNVVNMIDNETVVKSDKGETFRFTYDYSFWSFDQIGEYVDQSYVYKCLGQPLLVKAFEGYNTCLFAYGQTGSGKSYSMMGQESPEEEGIIPRFCSELFERIELRSSYDNQMSYNVEISYFEIYNEKIHDLLCPTSKDKAGKKTSLKVREHPELGPYVEELSSHGTNKYDDIKGWLSVGNKHRATAATGMNDKSSRSHSVFSIILTQTKVDVIAGQNEQHSIRSRINLVDLAGSERQGLAKTSGERLREGASINKSLHTLGKVISTLSEQSSMAGQHSTSLGAKKKKLFIPYRESVLTWLLKESLGGNSKTTMLATISPSPVHQEETLSTLRYAHQARSIVNTVRVNEDPKARLIRELRAQIECLRRQMGGSETAMEVSDAMPGASFSEIVSLKEQLVLKEKEMQEMTRSWQEKFKKSEEKREQEAKLLERSGIAFKVDNSVPHLVNLSEDPQLSETLLYVLQPGKTLVGRARDDSDADIQLSSLMIADHHCIIENADNQVTISPHGEALVYVNGSLVSKTLKLQHGDRVILGGDHFFRFVSPSGAKQTWSTHSSGTQMSRDFEYARQELVRVQNERMEAELQEARRQHEAELEEHEQLAQEELQRARHEADVQLTSQREEYERRMLQLQQQLQEHNEKRKELEEGTIKKLEEEKKALEKQLAHNQKLMEIGQSLQKQEVQREPSRLLELMAQEKQRAVDEQERLKARRARRAANQPTSFKKDRHELNSKGSFRKDLYRVVLLVKEANKISEFLQKSSVFQQEQHKVRDQDEPQQLIKVTQTKLGISTYWTLEKFENRLIQMKELCEGDGMDNETDQDDLFYDPNDVWEKEETLKFSPGISPKLAASLRRQSGIQGPIPFRLEAEGDEMQLDDLATSSSSFLEKMSFEQLSSVVCGFRSHIVDQLEDSKDTGDFTFSDWIMKLCQTVGSTITSFLTAYNTSGKDLGRDRGSLLTWLLQLQQGLYHLQQATKLWSSQYKHLSSTLVQQLCTTLNSTASKLASQAALFLQGYESDIDSMMQQSSADIFGSLATISECCGEMSLSTRTQLTSLSQNSDKKQLPDLRQDFVKGCDRFVDKTLQGGLKSLEDCEFKLQSLSESIKEGQEKNSQVLKHVQETVSCCRSLLAKVQVAEVELDSTIMSTRASLAPRTSTPSTNSAEESPVKSGFLQQRYEQCQHIVQEISQMADGLALLTQSAELTVNGSPDASMKRMLRCAEVTYKSVSKLLAIYGQIMLAGGETRDSISIDNAEAIRNHGQDAKTAIGTLGNVLKKEIEKYGKFSPSKAKRVLPMSPMKALNPLQLKTDSVKSGSSKKVYDLADAK